MEAQRKDKMSLSVSRISQFCNTLHWFNACWWTWMTYCPGIKPTNSHWFDFLFFVLQFLCPNWWRLCRRCCWRNGWRWRSWGRCWRCYCRRWCKPPGATPPSAPTPPHVKWTPALLALARSSLPPRRSRRGRWLGGKTASRWWWGSRRRPWRSLSRSTARDTGSHFRGQSQRLGLKGVHIHKNCGSKIIHFDLNVFWR